MEEATESAKHIREDIQEMRNKYGVVESQEKCAACDFPLLNRPFYLFLCRHMFHYDCLFQEVSPHLSTYKQAKLEELQKKLAAASQPTKARHRLKEDEAVNLGKGQLSREQIKSDIDDIVAGECVYCGDLMIKSIDKPFIDPQKLRFSSAPPEGSVAPGPAPGSLSAPCSECICAGLPAVSSPQARLLIEEEAKDSGSASLHVAKDLCWSFGNGFSLSITAGEDIAQSTLFNGKLKGYHPKGMNWLSSVYMRASVQLP
ncbi:hypothetical protein COCON_G00015270 [Conger conger]|uniref:Pep3/Vps18 RING C-terminal domain-containing protein n=1 Tax=Conger conger TaxID=82655 RepID=A0A9Q1I9I9_CONCO|nr:hypothetical protein COCON_G00015270 [Conger conger]